MSRSKPPRPRSKAPAPQRRKRRLTSPVAAIGLNAISHDLFSNPPALSRGRYRHYKGNEYDVLDLARHSETQEWIVVYRPRYGERGLWVRPYEMFLENVVIDGRSVPRFAFISE